MNISIFKIILVLFIIIISIFLSIPTFLNSTNNDNWYLNNKINLGLDLQGGSHILLEVKNQILLDEEINNIIDFFRQFIRNEKTPDFEIGHADFMKSMTFCETLNKKTIPLLNEYFRSDYPMITKALQESLPESIEVIEQNGRVEVKNK